MKRKDIHYRSARLFVLLAATILSLATSYKAVFAVEYIKNYSNFPAFPYNTTSYKQDGAFVGCGPTTGAMIFGYFDHEHGSNLVADPVSGVNEGLVTAWALHSWQYMKTNSDGFGSVYDIEPGLELYALDRGYLVNAVVHVSPTYNAGNAPQWLRDYGSYGDSWINDGDFWYQHSNGSWDINANTFCDFVHDQISVGVTVFLTIDSDGDGYGDHWVPLVGIDKSAGRYYFYDTYSTTVRSALIRYCGAVSQVNSISFVRTVSYEGPVNQEAPPTNLVALNNYKNSIPLAWKAPASLMSGIDDGHSVILQQNAFQAESQDAQIPFPFEAEEKFMQKSSRSVTLNPLAPTGYNIYRSTSLNGSYSKIASNISRQYYRDNSVTAGQTYYYKVTAIYASGESDFSNASSAQSSSSGYSIESGWAASAPTIDGQINSSEWADAETVNILYPGKSGTVTMYVMNNGSKLFLAVDDQRDTHVDDLDQFAIFFDKNLDREFPSSDPSDEGNFWVAWDAASSASFTLFGPRYGYWPDHLGWEPLVVPSGVEHGMSSSSGNIQYEASFDLTNSPLVVSADGTFAMLVFTYDYTFVDFNGFWPQESDRLREITSDINVSGQAPFSYGDVHLATPGPEPVTAPSNLVATAISTSQINLNWQDNSNDETGFRIERRKGTTGSWTMIGSSSANETTFQSLGLEANTTYYYRVYAYRNSDNSAYSNTAQATTFSNGNAVTISASDVSGYAGLVVDVPIIVSDVTGLDILSFTMTIATSTDVLTPIGIITTGTLIDGWGNVVTNTNGGQILVSGAGTTPLSGSGTLLIIQFQVNAAASANQTTPISFVNAMFNEGTPAAVSVDGVFTVAAGYDVSGTVEYFQNFHPISGVSLSLGSETALTANDGIFLFSTISGGNYDLIPSKDGDFGNSISAFDASQVLRYSVGLTTLEPFQLIAADVSGNGSVTSYDASYILRYTVGLVNSFPVGNNWCFVPADFNINSSNWNSAPDKITYSPLNSNMSNQDFKGIIYGDVTGNWSPMTLGKNATGAGAISFGKAKSTDKKQFDIPVIAKIADDLYSSKMSFHFNPQAVIFKGITLGKAMKDFSLVHRLDHGNLQIALAGTQPINSETELFSLQFELADGESSAPGVVELSDVIVNEGQIAVDISDREVLLNSQLPKTHQLQQNYPNPFNPTTTIEYSLSASAHVTLTIFDVSGKQVRQLVHGSQAAGRHSAVWDARDNAGKLVSSGIYFYRLEVREEKESGASFVRVRKMTLMK